MSFHSIATVLTALAAKLLALTLPGVRQGIDRDVVGAGGATVFGPIDSTDLAVGMFVESYDFPAGTNIVDVVDPGEAATIELSHAKLSSGTAPCLFYAEPAPVPMFETEAVKPYDRKDLIAAFRDLLVFEERACFIVPASLRHVTTDEGGVRIVRRDLELGLLVTDQNFGGENTALVGAAGANPGVLAIAEAVSDALIGESLGLAGVVVEVELADPFTLSDKEVEETKRAAFAIGIVIPMGERRINLGRRAALK